MECASAAGVADTTTLPALHHPHPHSGRQYLLHLQSFFAEFSRCTISSATETPFSVTCDFLLIFLFSLVVHPGDRPGHQPFRPISARAKGINTLIPPGVARSLAHWPLSRPHRVFISCFSQHFSPCQHIYPTPFVTISLFVPFVLGVHISICIDISSWKLHKNPLSPALTLDGLG